MSIFAGDGDHELFLSLLARTTRRLGWLCHAYCLMTTHYHLLTETPAANLADCLHRLNGQYAYMFNRARGRKGHVFEARYHAVLIQKESHLLEVARYIVLNPTRAGICRDPGAWPWSSYRATVGLEPPPAFLATDWLLGQLGTVRPEAQERYRRFVADGLDRLSWKPPASRVIGRTDFVRRFVAPPN